MLSYDYLIHEVRNETIDPGNVERPVNGLTVMLEACQKEGTLPDDIDARLLAITLWNTQQGTRGYYLRTGDRETSMAVLDMIEELLNRLSGSLPDAR